MRPRSREEADLEMTREEEKGKMIRTLMWIGVILAIVFSPVICCVGTGILSAIGAE